MRGSFSDPSDPLQQNNRSEVGGRRGGPSSLSCMELGEHVSARFRDGGQAVLRYLRHTVSADKQRFQDGTHDVDLTYITDRLIAMAFPASGVEAVYRNDISDVRALLAARHGAAYRVYNVSQRHYASALFDGDVVDALGWPDHHAPPLALLCTILAECAQFLLEDADHVVAVHCLAGKGRTGVVLASLLLWCGLCDTADGARAYYASQRSRAQWGVVQPAQVRYCAYIERLLHAHSILPSLPPALVLTRVTLTGAMPSLFVAPGRAGFAPRVALYDWRQVQPLTKLPLLWTSPPAGDLVGGVAATLSFAVPRLLVHGDLMLVLRHQSLFALDTVAKAVFSSCMVALEHADTPCACVLRLTKADLDVAEKDRRFPRDFCVELAFEYALSTDWELNNVSPAELAEDEAWLTMRRALNDARPGPAVLFTEGAGEGALTVADKIRRAREIAATRERRGILAGDGGGEFVSRGGWLTKRGQNVKSWKRRWFVLQRERLNYFTKPNALKPQGSVLVADIVAVHELDANESPADCPSPYGLAIVTLERTLLACAENDRECEDWIDAMHAAIALQQRTQTASGEPSAPSRERRWATGNVQLAPRAPRPSGDV